MEELKQTVQKGHKLLRKKEERLSQLENSLVEEVHAHTYTHTHTVVQCQCIQSACTFWNA